MSLERDEVRRFLEILHTFLRMLGVSNREVERRLDLKHGTISRFLNGQIEAKLDLVLAVAHAIGLESEELFAFVYPGLTLSGPESDSARRLRAMLEGLRPPRRSLAGGTEIKGTEFTEEIKRAVREVLKEMAAEKGTTPGR